MVKETKVGLVIIGVLLLAFGLVLWRRVAGTADPIKETAQVTPKKQPSKSIARLPKPRVVSPRVDESPAPTATPRVRLPQAGMSRPSDLTDRSRGNDAPSEPSPSFLPADDRLSSPSSTADRYRRRLGTSDSEEPVEEEANTTSPSSTAGNPFERPRLTNDVPAEVPREDSTDTRATEAVAAGPTVAATSSPRSAADDRYSERRTSGSSIRVVPAADELPADLPEAAPFDWPRTTAESHDDARPENPADATVSWQAEENTESSAGEETADVALSAPLRTVPPPPGWRTRSSQPLPKVSLPIHDDQQPRPAISSRQPAAAIPADEQYVVQPRDNFWKISQRFFGTGAFFRALFEHNRDQYADPDEVREGDVLWVPTALELRRLYPDLCPQQIAVEQVEQEQVVSVPRRRPVAGKTYIVQEGDTLFDIARYELGKATRWAEIYELNRDALDTDLNQLQPGMRLLLPAERSAAPIAGRRHLAAPR